MTAELFKIMLESKLNSNIRCIEIPNDIIEIVPTDKLNSNIRCIEMPISHLLIISGLVE